MGRTTVGRIESGWWMVKARLHCNGKIYPKEIDFFIDTCAEYTVLSDQEAKPLGLGFDTLTGVEKIDISGAGKCMGRPLLNAGIVFSGDDKIKGFFLEICPKILVPDPKDYHARCNLIGLDILKHYREFRKTLFNR
jgi:hypothetical protein